MTDKIIVHTTCGSEEEAARVARHLVAKRVAACVAVTPGTRSYYHWKGALEESDEWSLAIKTQRGLFGELCRELRSVHSYEVPELLAVPVVEGSDDYLGWMDAELQGGLGV
jgi:periplasmic divalent cation tolerance protein